MVRQLQARFIPLWIVVTLALLLYGCNPVNSQAIENNPSACDCNTITISTDEEHGGCPASVKREACPKFREMEQWQEKLKKQEESRELENRMNPRVTPRVTH